MIGFDKPLRMEKLLKRRWKVLEEFSYTDAKGRIFTIPMAYVTDLASVPRLFWGLFPPDGDYSQSAVLHDYLCEKKLLPWKETHLLFDEAMGVAKVEKVERVLMAKTVLYLGPRW